MVELIQYVQYPAHNRQERGSPKLKTWLALLLGEFVLEQQDFYDLEGILVSLKCEQ